VGLTALNGIILGSAGYFGVHYMDSPKFCGEVCHTVMLPEYTAYQGSPHSRVHCVQCHIGPGASWFVKSKLDGLRQVWKTTWNTFERPIPSPVKTLRPAQQTCEQCHWPSKHHGDKVRVIARFAEDEGNTAAYSVMLLKTGGGDLDSGRHGGIHWWHIYGDNKIRYLASDERRQEIAWVELVTPDGATYVYTNDGAEPPPPERIATEARTMDCIDCHNRPTHLFLPPPKAVDEVLAALPDLRDLPYFKREVTKAVGQQYPSNREGAGAVRTAILSYYRSNHPEVATGRKALVERGADEAARIYQRSFFPEMNADWQTHPNNIGHEDFPGCFRCHDGSKATADGERMIPVDCENCHAFLAEDAAALPDLERLRLALAP
jgi:nitrate/TMAO reductase-like tetraheme cytochrome c subunit